MPPSEPESLLEAVRSGVRITALVALRDRLATDLDTTDSKRDVASLAQRLMDVLLQIESIAGEDADSEARTGLSEFEKRLRERESTAKTPRSSKSG